MSLHSQKTVLIWGREPAIFVGLVQAAVAFVAFFVVPLTDAQTTGIVAVVNAGLGLYIAYVVRPITVAAVTALIQAVLVLLVGFSVDISQEQQGVILTLAAVILNIVLVRPQVTPTQTLRNAA